MVEAGGAVSLVVDLCVRRYREMEDAKRWDGLDDRLERVQAAISRAVDKIRRSGATSFDPTRVAEARRVAAAAGGGPLPP
jgi:hypothetical protein